MDKHLDIKMALRVFHKVLEKGEKKEDGYHYDGLTASESFDGYTLTLKDRDVTLLIFFHNEFDLQFKHEGENEDFIRLLERIDEGET